MSIILGQGCHKVSVFKAAHRNVDLGNIGNDFFTVKTRDELQKYVDNTYQKIKSLYFEGNNQTIDDAKALLKRARSDSGETVTVIWGIHQSQNRPANLEGSCQHFTVKGHPNDWHLYVNTKGQKISFMSNGATPQNMVTIRNNAPK